MLFRSYCVSFPCRLLKNVAPDNYRRKRRLYHHHYHHLCRGDSRCGLISTKKKTMMMRLQSLDSFSFGGRYRSYCFAVVAAASGCCLRRIVSSSACLSSCPRGGHRRIHRRRFCNSYGVSFSYFSSSSPSCTATTRVMV